jgi:16S rRNA (uracil1498-N3)-methyltransferase
MDSGDSFGSYTLHGLLHGLLEKQTGELAVIIGPEGGLDDKEVEILLKNKAFPVYLGSRVLRAETAAVYSIAAIQTIIREKAAWRIV